MKKFWKVKRSETLSTSTESRFVVVHKLTGKLLDDCRGYGYKSFQKAYDCYSWKHC